MDESIKCTLIGVLGTILGLFISFVFQIIITMKQNQKENRRATYQLLVDTYADAIRYISLCCALHRRENNVGLSEDDLHEKELYDKFHPVFSVIAPKEIVTNYNELRNNALKGVLTEAEAYQKAVELLNFNISKEISNDESL